MLIPDLIPSSCLHMSCKRILHDICKQYSAGHRFTSLFRRILDWRIFLAVSAVVVVQPYPWRCVQCSKALNGKGKRNFLLIISMHTPPPPSFDSHTIPGKNSSPICILLFPKKTYCQTREIFH